MKKSIHLHPTGLLDDLLALIDFISQYNPAPGGGKERKVQTRDELLSEFFGRGDDKANAGTVSNALISTNKCKPLTKTLYHNFCDNFRKYLSSGTAEINNRFNTLEKQENSAERSSKWKKLAQQKQSLTDIEKIFDQWKNRAHEQFNIPSFKKARSEKRKHRHGKKIAMAKREEESPTAYGEVEAVVTSFHEKLGAGDYTGAWELLHPPYKKRIWGSDIQKFMNTYVNSRGNKHIHVFQTAKVSPTIIECKIYFEQEMTVSHSPNLKFLQSATVGHIDEVLRIVKELHEELVEIDSVEFERIRLYKLMEVTASEYIWYKCGISPEAILQVLPSGENVSLNRLYHCTCTLTEGRWLISRLRKMEITAAH